MSAYACPKVSETKARNLPRGVRIPLPGADEIIARLGPTRTSPSSVLRKSVVLEGSTGYQIEFVGNHSCQATIVHFVQSTLKDRLKLVG